MMQILSLEIDAAVFLWHKTALGKTPPLTPEFATFHITVLWVQVMSIPAPADGDQRYGWCQAGLLLLLKNCFQLQSKNPHVLRWPKSGKCWAVPLPKGFTNIWKNYNGPSAYSPKRHLVQNQFSLTSSDICPYFSINSWGAGDTLSSFQGFNVSVK